jgi:DNA-directed RNA polymerase subunit RPC12/RpoP
MEPTGRARHGRTVYTCPECGHEMETPEREEDGEDEEVENDSD